MNDLTPNAFWLALPAGWVSIDVDARTSAASARRLVAAAAAADEHIRSHRHSIERMLVESVTEAAAAGINYCAVYYEQFDDLAVQANLTVANHAAAEGTDLNVMTQVLDTGDERTISVVELEAGRAVCRSGIRHTRFPGTEEAMDLLTHQYFLPVPGTTDSLTVVSFASPTLALEEDLRAVFESIAQTFAFVA